MSVPPECNPGLHALFTTEDDEWRGRVVEDGDGEEHGEDVVDLLERRGWGRCRRRDEKGTESRAGLAGSGGDEASHEECEVIARGDTVLIQ